MTSDHRSPSGLISRQPWDKSWPEASSLGIIWRASTSAYCLIYILWLCQSRLVCVETLPEENKPAWPALHKPCLIHIHTPRVALQILAKGAGCCGWRGTSAELWCCMCDYFLGLRAFLPIETLIWSRSESRWEMSGSDFTAVLHVKSLQCTDCRGLLLHLPYCNTVAKNIRPRLSVLFVVFN